MYQAIITKWLGPTNFKPGRIKATADAGSLTMSWDHGLNADANHRKAAEALRNKLGWNTEFYGTLEGGGLPGNTGCAFVFCRAPNSQLATRPFPKTAAQAAQDKGEPQSWL
jgi:hypothetical protein